LDIESLLVLTDFPEAPLRKVRASTTALAHYAFDKGSGRGFGATIQIGPRLYYEFGQWETDDAFGTSSNRKELGNLVLGLERKAKEDLLQNFEVFLFTNNTTTESAFWKGSTKSRTLFDWVLRFKRLKMGMTLFYIVMSLDAV
jgi:hypothetical protein